MKDKKTQIQEKERVLQSCLSGEYTNQYAAKLLQVSIRRVQQLKTAYRSKGKKALSHGNSKKQPPNTLDAQVRDAIIELKKSDLYKKANFVHFREFLEKREDIHLSYSTVYRILKKAGIKSPRTHRGKKVHKRRKRRARFGELLQADASSFDWFDEGKRYALHGFIDDSSGQPTGLYLCQNECLLGYLEVLRQNLLNFGIPLSLYPDKHGIFFVNEKHKTVLTLEEQLSGETHSKTQFGKIIDKLGIDMFPAHSPQAKGRIERLWNTLHDRLLSEFKVAGIRTVEKANEFLKHYVFDFGKRFAVPPEEKESYFVPYHDERHLDILLSATYQRKTDSCGCFSFYGFMFQVDAPTGIFNKTVQFFFSQKVGLKAQIDGKTYDVLPLADQPLKKSGISDVASQLFKTVFTDAIKY